MGLPKTLTKPVVTKPAAPPAPAPKVAAPAAKAPAKPLAAPPKPAPAAAPAAAAVTRAEFEKFTAKISALVDTCVEAQVVQNQRIDRLDLALSGFNKYVTTDEAGNIVLNEVDADATTLKEWAWIFDICDPATKPEAIRKAIAKARTTAGFDGWVQKRELPIGSEQAADEEEEVAEEGEEESAGGEEEEMSVDDVKQLIVNVGKANWASLTQTATEMEIDFSDIKSTQPKVLKGRIIEALEAHIAGIEGGGEEEVTEETEEEEAAEGFTEGQAVIVQHPETGEDYPSTFVSYGDDGSIIVTYDGEEEPVAAPADCVRAA